MTPPTLAQIEYHGDDAVATCRHVPVGDYSRRWPTCHAHEEWLLGAVLAGGEAIHHTWFLLVPSDFDVPIHRGIWATCLTLYHEGHAVHDLTVADELPERLAADVFRLSGGFTHGDDERAVLLARAAHIKWFSSLRRRMGLQLAGPLPPMRRGLVAG